MLCENAAQSNDYFEFIGELPDMYVRMGIVWAPHSEFTTISGNIIRMWMCDCILSRFPISLNS